MFSDLFERAEAEGKTQHIVSPKNDRYWERLEKGIGIHEILRIAIKDSHKKIFMGK